MIPEEIAARLLGALDARRQIPPLSANDPALDIAAAYRAAGEVRRLREARGERVVGRKIGFTNTTIWAEYGVGAPIWGYVYDTTVHRLGPDARFDLSHLVEPRIEPEIMFELARAPEPDMDERALVSCIAWVAYGFELVQSLFPGWRFAAADTVAAFGLHGALFVGDPQRVSSTDPDGFAAALAGFSVDLLRNGERMDRGFSANVLGGGPLTALRHLVTALASDAESPPLQSGEIISTGTLTRAFPVAPGDTWASRLSGLSLPPAHLRLT